jgi:hypothetical protein
MEILKKILVNDFNSISLSEIETASLMNRRDTKYVIDLPCTAALLQYLSNDYKVLEIDSKRIFKYHSTYFDTDTLTLFKQHHTGRLNRYKIRFRNYVDTGSAFFEIKYKNNHGRTLKSRISTTNNDGKAINSKEMTFLETTTPLNPKNLISTLSIDYDRITLINAEKTERVTIDLNLTFVNGSETKKFANMAVIEVKHDKTNVSLARTFFKNSKIRMGGISKYCIGVMLLFEKVNQNRFKHKYNRIYKKYHQVAS